jgi:hypothetical protein
MSKLTDAERTIIVDALTAAAHQYEKDAATAHELAMQGVATMASAEALGAKFQQRVTDARELRDKLEFLWNHIQF